MGCCPESPYYLALTFHLLELAIQKDFCMSAAPEGAVSLAQGRERLYKPMSQRLPTQPSSQTHCQGLAQLPCKHPGKGTH